MIVEHSNVNYLRSADRQGKWAVTVSSVGSRRITGRTGTCFPGNGNNEECITLHSENHSIRYVRYLNAENDIIQSGVYFMSPGEDLNCDHSLSRAIDELWIELDGIAIERVVGDIGKVGELSIDDPSLDETLLELFHRSLLISSQKKEDHLLTLTGIVMHITGLLNYRLYCRNYAQQELADKIGKAKELMRDNVKENLNGRQLASRLGMGYDNFRRTFKKITGISPAQYMQDIKLEEAKKMLACSSISVKEISYDLNYENPCYFSKAFKKKEGMSPGEYRQMYEGILSIAT